MAWTFSFSTELNPITIYLAVVATGVAAWQVYTYFRDGPHLRLTAGGNQIIAGTTGPTIFIGVSAVNIGNRTTIIQSVGMRVYDNWWQWFRRRGSKDIFFGIARGTRSPCSRTGSHVPGLRCADPQTREAEPREASLHAGVPFGRQTPPPGATETYRGRKGFGGTPPATQLVEILPGSPHRVRPARGYGGRNVHCRDVSTAHNEGRPASPRRRQ
jgi:hypothetical protein